jgi:hypothetical protein
MAVRQIGSVKSGKTKKTFYVYWNAMDKAVYISWEGKTSIGKACSSLEALNKAKDWLLEK